MFDVFHGRLLMYVPKDKPRKMKFAVIGVAYFLPYWTPNYAYRCPTFLSYTVNGDFYKIYNPDRYPFNLERIKHFICHHHLIVDKAQAKNFQILENRH